MLVEAIDDVSSIRAGGSRVAVTSFSDRRDQLLNITAGGSLTAVTAAIGMSDARVSMWKISLTIVLVLYLHSHITMFRMYIRAYMYVKLCFLLTYNNTELVTRLAARAQDVKNTLP